MKTFRIIRIDKQTGDTMAEGCIVSANSVETAVEKAKSLYPEVYKGWHEDYHWIIDSDYEGRDRIYRG